MRRQKDFHVSLTWMSTLGPMPLTISAILFLITIHRTQLPHLFDSSAIANQESLSGLEVEMRKLEGIVKEIFDEMVYLKAREERFTDTNGQPSLSSRPCKTHRSLFTPQRQRTNESKTLPGLPFSHWLVSGCGRYYISARSSSGNTLLIE